MSKHALKINKIPFFAILKIFCLKIKEITNVEKKSLIIVDNSRDFCNILNEYLSMQNDIVVTGIANNGVEALRLIEEKKPDLIVIDIIMPILDGIGVLKRINTMHLNPMPHIIVVSSISQKNIIQRVMSIGADYYIVKPFIIEAFIEKIRQIFNNTSNDKKPLTYIYKG